MLGRDVLGIAKLRRRERSDLHPSDPRTRLRDDELQAAADLVVELIAALATLECLRDAAHPFAELAARDNIDFVRGQLLPQISVVGTLSRTRDQSLNFKGTLSNSAQITAQLTMPLYEGGAIYSQTRQAEQTVGQRRSQVDDARRAAVQTATTSWSTLQAARASISSGFLM